MFNIITETKANPVVVYIQYNNTVYLASVAGSSTQQRIEEEPARKPCKIDHSRQPAAENCDWLNLR